MAFSPRRLMRGASGTSAASADAQFNYVTMLLHGDGTNGAQNNTFLDSGPNTLSITRNGNTTQGSFSPYGSNWSNFFPNASPATNYLVSSSVSLSGDFTIEGYVNWNGEGPNPAMFTLGDSSLSTGIEVYKSGANWILFASNGNRVTGSAAVAGQWTYLAVTRSGTTVTLYINGVSQGTWTSSQTFSGTIKVGAEFYGSTYYSSMSGYISNFRVNNTTAINTVPTAPLTAVSGTIFLTCQSNRFIDNSASPLTITVTGTPSVQRFNPFGTSTAYSTSVIGGSGYFDGAGDNLVVSGTGSFNPRSTFTVEFWTYPITNFTVNWINSNTNDYFYIETFEGTLYVGDGSFNTIGTTPPALNRWTHVLLSFDGTTYRLFYNGVSQVTSTGLLASNTITAFRIGQKNDTSRPFNGYITDLRVLVGTALQTSAFTPPTAPLSAISNTSVLLKFQNAAIFDNAMMNDLETVGNAQISTSVKKYGTGSMLFDGDGDWLKAPNSPNFDMGSGNFTIEGWFYQTATGGQICAKYEASYQSSWAIGFDGANWDVYTYYSTTSNLAIYTGVAGPTLNTWNHFALERNGANIEFYLNGSRVAQVAAQTMRTTTSAVAIGNLGQGYSSFFTGYIDDIRITKGYARYSGTTYTMPTAAFSDTGPV